MHTLETHHLPLEHYSRSNSESLEQSPRIALLTPYGGHNLGDAAIQDALIANIRARLPNVQFSGISLNNDNFVARHGIEAFPLCVSSRPFYAMGQGQVERLAGETGGKELDEVRTKKIPKPTPGLWRYLKEIHSWATTLGRELRHCVEGYSFLRSKDLLVVSGGGQLDEEWGGPWGHPWALFKWAVLARIAKIPYVISSVGACKVTSRTSRFLLSMALRMSVYRSYRDSNSRAIAASLLRTAVQDSVVPDLAFSLPSSELPPPAGIRSISQGRQIVAISPIAFASPRSWPYQNRDLYNRYVQIMAQVVSQLLKRNYFLVFVWSSLRDDERVIPELMSHLDDDSKARLVHQMYIPTIATWKDLLASLLDADFLIASRLHSVILGFVARKPTIAISFDPKVDWVMKDLDQTEYLLLIGNFKAEEVIDALCRIELRKSVIVEQIASYGHEICSLFTLQYDALSQLAREYSGCRN